MASGSFAVSTNNGYVSGTVNWSESSVNTANNTSVVTATMYLSRTNTGYTTSGTGTFNLVINGVNISKNLSYSITYDSNTLMVSGSTTVTHSTDGSKSITISWSGGGGAYDPFTVNGGSGTATLTKIARASTISSSVSWTAGTQNLSVSLSVADSSFYHTLTIEVFDASSNATIVNRWYNVKSSYTIPFSVGDNTTMYNILNKRSSCTATLFVDTYDSSGNHIGSQTNKSGTCYAASAATPKVPDFNIGDTVSITMNLPNSEFTCDLDWSWGSINGGYKPQIASKTGTPFSWVTANYASGMYQQIPNSSKGWGTMTCTTYYHGYQVQSPVSVSPVNATVTSASSSPSFGTGYTYADTDANVPGITGNNQAIVQNQSNLTVTLPVSGAATANNYAAMSYYVATINGVSVQQNYSSSATVTFNMGKVNASANQTLSIKAVDSRGFSKTTSITVTIIPYSPPVISTKSTRANGFDTSVDLKLSGSYSLCNVTTNGTTTAKNSLVTVQYAYKKTTDTAYPTPTAFTYSTNVGSYSVSPDVTLSLDTSYAWNVQVTVVDKFGNISTSNIGHVVNTQTVSAGQPTAFMDATLNSFAVGAFPVNSNSIEAPNFYEGGTALVDKYGPAGMICMTAASSAPAGWILCNGAYVSRTTYARLFAAIGTQYNGVSDTDATKFRLPNFVGRMPIGIYTGDSDFATLGKPGGEKTHILTTSEIPSHDHQVTANGGYYAYGGSAGNPAGGSGYGTQLSTLRTGQTGGDGAHNNMPPYTVINFIIKI